MKSVNCLLCGKSAQVVEQNYPGYQDPNTFSICYCSICNTQFSYPRVETGLIYELIYKNAEKLQGYDRYYKYKNTVKNIKNPLKYLANSEETYWVIKEALKKEDGLKILEVGCGMGYLTYALHKEGYTITGLDISKNAIESAIRDFGEYYVCADVFEYADMNKEKYDRIILTQVIEHVENPIKWIEKLMMMVKKDGKIIMTTENKTIFPENAIWQSDLPPVHLWWFSEQSMKYIADILNVSVSFIDFSKYKNAQQGVCIVPVSSRKHLISKNGEILQKTTPNIKSLIYNVLTKNLFIRFMFYKYIHPLDIRFGKRRAVMGIIFTKEK